ncbi:hypothetical protein ACFQUU_25805 [Herbaspirillum sp. GCM10030257]|uniref:hypothetical protein n=1 Tax=Herbaspirillum sp. GCM10030257 TaxID=3273393 RepID=UPI00361318A1
MLKPLRPIIPAATPQGIVESDELHASYLSIPPEQLLFTGMAIGHADRDALLSQRW